MKRLAVKGALLSRRGGLDPEKLGPLETHEDALRWLREIGRAVVCGVLPHQPARVGIQAVEAWVTTEGERVTALVVEDLKAEVEALKLQLRPGLRTVP